MKRTLCTLLAALCVCAAACGCAPGAQSASGAYEKLAAHLDSLYTMERVTLGSIF